MSTISFVIPTDLELQKSLTLSGVYVAPTGTNRLRVGGDFTLNLADSGNLASQIATAAGVLSFNGLTGTIVVAGAPAPLNFVTLSQSGNTFYVSGSRTPELSGVLLAGGTRISGNAGTTYVNGSMAVTGSVRLGKNARLEQDNSVLAIAPLIGLDTSNYVAIGAGLSQSNGIYLNASTVLLAGVTNVGVGSDNPIYKLDVSGQIRSTNNVIGSGFYIYPQLTGDYSVRSGAASIAQLFYISGLLGLPAPFEGTNKPIPYATGSRFTTDSTLAYNPVTQVLSAGGLVTTAGVGAGAVVVGDTYLNIAGSFANASSMRIASGSANPTVPQNGDIWFGVSGLYFRHGAITRVVAWA